MRRASIIAVLTTLLLVTACGSDGDDKKAEDGDRPDSGNSASSDPSEATDGESESTSDASPTGTDEPSEPAGSDDPSEPPAGNHDPAKPTVTTEKKIPADSCAMLTAQDLAAAKFGKIKTAQKMPDGGCAAEASGGNFDGLVYGVPPKEGNGKAPTGPMKVQTFEIKGNTAVSGCYAQASTCTAEVAIGGGRWAVVHLASRDFAKQRGEAVKVAKLLVERMFNRLPNA